MQAIILAAGMGKRLKELTQNNTKCMVKVNGVTLIDRMLHQIEKKQVSRIVIVVGYEGQKLIDYIQKLEIKTPVVFINNPIYDKTNNIYSLALAKEWLIKEDTLLFESDIIFEDSILDELIEDPRDTLALVDKYEPWMDGTCLKLFDDDSIEAFISKKNFQFNDINNYYKTVNIYKFSKDFSEKYYLPFLDAYQMALGRNEYYEQVLRVVTMLDESVIKAKRLNGQRWYEIDDIQDLDIAESIFTNNEDDKVRLLLERYGGYWRYPKLVDFYHPVNTFFPPKRMIDELKANFDVLLTEYPSSMKVMSLLAAKNFDVYPENIIVGCGTPELIKSLLKVLQGSIGIINSPFNEYENLYESFEIYGFTSDAPDFTYDTNDLISYFNDKKICNLIISNPDLSTGNFISKKDLFELIRWTGNRNINIIIDESFVDFVDENNNSLLSKQFLFDNPHLYIVKSISKSFGTPGLRLGILASGNVENISEVKKDVSYWKINSFAEYYLQIEEKYTKEYTESVKQSREEKRYLESQLDLIPGIHILASHSNFIIFELKNDYSSKELLKKLLLNHNMLVKDLENKDKTKNYIRIAVRSRYENRLLIEAIKKELSIL